MAELKIMPADGPVGYKTIPADRPLLIGAGEDCDIRIKGSGIRDEHCHIGFKRGSYYVEAIQGAREIKLNGTKVENAKLKSDDDISVGKHRFVLKMKPEEEAQLAKAAQAAATQVAQVYYKPFYQGRLFQGIAVGLVALTALATWLYFDFRKKSSEKAFDSALESFTSGEQQQAMKSFDKFREDYPSSPLVEAAKYYRGYAGVKQYTDGASTNWKEALVAVREFVSDFNKYPQFAEQSKKVAETVAKIAEGLAIEAGKRPDADALVKSQDALKVIDDSFSRADRPEEKIQQIQTLMTEARRSIEKDAKYRAAKDKMQSSLAAKKPIELYREHQKLYRAYPELKADRALAAMRQKAGEIEREQVVFEAINVIPKPPAAKPVEVPALTTYTRRATAAAKKSGNPHVVQVADAIYALDTGDGTVLWRQVVGFDPAFEPQVIKGRGVLHHAPNTETLELANAKTGQPIWRQSTKATQPGWASRPLVQGNSIYFYSLDPAKAENGRMVVHRFEDGRPIGQYTFPQRLSGSPSFDPQRNAILAVGQQVSLYSIQSSTRTCDAVVVLDHEAEAVHCAPVYQGGFLFLVEEIKAEQSRLRCMVLSEGKAEARQKQAIDLRGAVWNEPYINFGRLFIATDLNRFSVYDINDIKDNIALTEVLRSGDPLESKGDRPWPFAPSREAYWNVGQKLAAFELGVGATAAGSAWEIQLDGAPIMTPVQDAGLVLITSRATGTGVISVLALDPKTHKEVWKTELGKQPGAAALDPADGKTMLVTIGEKTERLKAADFSADKLVELKLPADPLIANRSRKPVAFKTIREWTDGVLQWPGVEGRSLVYFSTDGKRSEYPLRSPLASRPIVLGKSVLAPARDGLLYSIDPKSGKETSEPFVGVYSKEGQPMPMGPIAALDDHTVIAVSGSKILRLELATDKTPPEFLENGAVDVGVANIEHMIGIQGKLLLAYGRELALLDPKEMKLGKKWAIDAGIAREPISLAGVVLLMTDAGELICVANGDKGADLRWKIKLQGEPAGVTASGPFAWVAYSNGKLQKIDLKSGQSSAGPSFQRFIVDGPWVPGDRIVALTPDGSLASVAIQGGE